MAGERDRGAVDQTCRGTPAGPLCRYVAWYVGYRQAGVPPARHRGLPSPFLTLIFTLDEPLTVLAHPDPGQAPGEYRALLGGLHSSPALIAHAGAQSGIQVALRPLGARALLGLPAGELAQTDVPAESVLGGVCAELRDRLGAAGGWPERFAVVDEILLRLLSGRLAGAGPASMRPDVPGEVGWAWHRLLRSGGAVRVSELAAETGWSGRHLAGRFRAEIGLSPKAAARVVRFHRARNLLVRRAAAGSVLLADIAADCGYFDQAHLAREFGALAGCPPSQWLAEEAGSGEFRNVQAVPGPDGQAWADGPGNGPATRRKALTMQETAPPPQVWPTLRAHDARGLIRFLVEAFGFQETVVYGEGERVDHAELLWPEGGGIMLGSVRDDHGGPTEPGTFGAYVVTADPDAVYKRATAAGAQITGELHETDYGSRDFAARDPEGNRWNFGTYRGAPRKAG